MCTTESAILVRNVEVGSSTDSRKMRLAVVHAVSAAFATSSRAMIWSLTFSARAIVASSFCRSSANSKRNFVADLRRPCR
jgi:hypothetical protein